MIFIYVLYVQVSLKVIIFKTSVLIGLVNLWLLVVTTAVFYLQRYTEFFQNDWQQTNLERLLRCTTEEEPVYLFNGCIKSVGYCTVSQPVLPICPCGAVLKQRKSPAVLLRIEL